MGVWDRVTALCSPSSPRWLLLIFFERCVSQQWCSAYAEKMAVSTSKSRFHSSLSKKGTEWTCWFEKVMVPWNKVPRSCERGGGWEVGSFSGSEVQDRPLHGLRKEYTEGNKSKCPKSKASSCYPRTEDTPGWLEKSKKKEREQTRMLTVKEAGAFVPKEQNLGFTLCVERSYWNVLNWEVICIF